MKKSNHETRVERVEGSSKIVDTLELLKESKFHTKTLIN